MEQNIKKRIADTLKDMIKQSGPDKITVAKLVEKCQISRSLFYYYFNDIFDVMIYHLENDLNQAINASLKVNSPKDSLTMFLNAIMAQRTEINRILNSRYREQAEREMLRAGEIYTRQLIEERFLTSAITAEELKYLTKCAAYLIFGFVMDNQSATLPETAKFADHVVRFTVGQKEESV